MSRPVSPRACLSILVLGAVLAPGVACGPVGTPQCPPVEDEVGCTGQRFIAITDPALPCPKDNLGIWTEAKLFKGPPAGAPPELARYCVYEWTGARVGSGSKCATYGANGPLEGEIEHLRTLLGATAELGEDCIDTGPLTFADDAAAWARSSLFKRAGGVQPLPAVPTSPEPARLVAIDTSPDALSGGIALGQSRHGDTIAHTARDLACPDGEAAICGAHVSTVLGLPRFDLNTPLATNLVQGGLFGTEGDLAAAVERAVLDWRADVLQNATVERLVLNLSVGWEERLDRDNCAPAGYETNTELLSPPARAVLDALRYATCHGALTLAAAGNDIGGSTPSTGLVCPARWEAVAGLDLAACNAMLGEEFTKVWDEKWQGYPRYPDPVKAPYNRIVYAVSGVDQGDLPLVPSRTGAHPRIAALGLLGSAWDSSATATYTPNANGQPVTRPPVISGSSISTAVASAIAATYWSYNPTLTAPEVLNAIYQSGVVLQQNNMPLRADADTCIGAPQCDVHRLSLCRAIGAMCSDIAPVGEQGQALPNSALPIALAATLDQEFPPPMGAPSLLPDTQPIPHNNHTTIAASPWTFPQPNWPSCPACVLRIPGPNDLILYAKPGVELQEVTLVLIDSAGVQRSARIAPIAGQNTARRIAVTMQNANATQTRQAWLSAKAVSPTGTVVSVYEQLALTAP